MCLKELLLLLCICFFCCCYLLIQKDIVNLGVSMTSLQPFEPIKMQFKALLVRLSPQFTKKFVYMRILIIIIVFFLLCVVCIMRSSAMLSHVEKYEVIRPQRLPGRHKRSLGDNQVTTPHPHHDTWQSCTDFCIKSVESVEYDQLWRKYLNLKLEI